MPLLFPARLHTFIESRFRHPDTNTVNILNSSLAAWSRYFSFLETIYRRYQEATKAYVDAVTSRLEALQRLTAETGQTGARTFTQEEWEEMRRTSALGLLVHLEIESFYVFANILLDRIASSFRFYFWKRADWNHMQLVTNFDKVCSKKSLTMTPPDLSKMPQELHEHIVGYRNKRIEHVEEPRFQFGTQWGSDKRAKIAPSLLYPTGSELESAQEPTGDIDEIMALLDRYMTAMLDFFDANANKSILPPAKPAA